MSISLTGHESKDEFCAQMAQLTPPALDAQLRALGDGVRYPAWLIGKIFLPMKQEAGAADAMLQAAAACSAHARRLDLLQEGRTSDREGSFAYITIPDAQHPEESLVVKVHRHTKTGRGIGSLGGLLETWDNDDVRPKRELIEELIDDYEMDAALEADAREVIEAMDMVPLFTARDDAHAIHRGWGYTVDAHAHMAIIPPAMMDKARDVFLRLQQATPKSAAETYGLEVMTLKELPTRVPEYFYGHEAFGDMVAAQVAFDRAGIGFDVLSHYRATNPQALEWMAKKMFLRESDLVNMHQRVCEDARAGQLESPGDRPHRRFTLNDYVYACDPPTASLAQAQAEGTVQPSAVQQR